MQKRYLSKLFGFLILSSISNLLYAQTPLTETKAARLFASDDVLAICILADFRAIQKDRGDDPSYHDATLTYAVAGQDSVQLPLKVKARGNFRRASANCNLPPLLLNFPKKKVKGTVFENQDKLKLVTRCRDEEDVEREYLVYKLYNLLTEFSFKARLVAVTYQDSTRKKSLEASFGFLIEAEDALAERHGTNLRAKKRKTTENLADHEGMATLAVFQYMIGNTDWSVPYQHNIKLLERTIGLPMPVAYDFDHSGIVGARYAHPAPELGIQSTRQRLYRGLNYSDELFQTVFEKFDRIKPQVYALYRENPNLRPDYVKRTLKYFDEFYETIGDADKVKSLFTKAKGKNVVIKGLKN